MFVAGPAYLPTAYRDTRVGALLPLRPDRAILPPQAGLSRSFQVRPTSLGLAAPQLQLGVNALDSARVWHPLPGLYWLLEADQWKPGVRVLVEHSSNTGQDGQPLPVRSSSPLVGEHNEWVLREILGLSEEEYLECTVQEVV